MNKLEVREEILEMNETNLESVNIDVPKRVIKEHK